MAESPDASHACTTSSSDAHTSEATPRADPTSAAPTDATESLRKDATSAGASTTATDAAVRDPRSSSAASASAAADAGAAAASAGGSSVRKGEDGYVTPPLRAGSTGDAAPKLHDQREQQQQSAQETRHAEVLSATSPSAELNAQATQDCSLDSFARHVTPTLFTAQAPPPVGRILSPTGNKRKRVEPRTTTDSSSSSSSASAAIIKRKPYRPPLPSRNPSLVAIAMAQTASAMPRRKGSGDYLRKGQWTATEEKFARALIEAFEDGYLPIYTGIRLRGYLAVQLQCDPMRISKKLCGGSVDGRAVPKNYGQRKFKLRKKQSWDPDAAAQVLARLEQLERELWAESGLPRPEFLTLSSTRNAGDEAPRSDNTGGHAHLPHDDVTSSSSESVRPDALPIIYLNLSKRPKTSGGAALMAAAAAPSAVRPATAPTTDTESSDAKVDGDSLQAAYELLKLFQASPEADAA